MSRLVPFINMEALRSPWLLAGAIVLPLLGYQLARILYHAFLSPLRRVPGPLHCSLTGSMDTYQSIVGGKRSAWIHSLHQKYGKLRKLGSCSRILSDT